MRKLIFVCTGNTCRSPMAEMVAKHILKKNKIRNVKVDSCGIFAETGLNMCENAKIALQEKGIQPQQHKSKQIDKDMTKDSFLLVGMTKSHADICSTFADSICLSKFNDGNDISDPYGGDLDTYKKCLDVIYNAVEKLINEYFISQKKNKKS